MESKIKYMFLKTVQDDCIIPVTSVCNMNCLFCSHHNNPRGLEVYRAGHLELDFIREILDYLPAQGPVIIGESATKIIEGEPFAHPDIMSILGMIRDKNPDRLIKITTNGSFLTSCLIEELQSLLPLELNISLNCSSPDERVFLMFDKSPEVVFESLKLLAENQIKYNGSLVAVPEIIGWESVEKTIKILDKHQAESIRVFLPGFSKYAEPKVKFDVKNIYNRLRKLIEKLAQESTSSLMLEPPLIKDLTCSIKGVITESPADKAGIERNDIITKVDGKKVITRVETFNKIKKSKNPVLDIYRENYRGNTLALEIKVEKEKDENSGIIVDYDLSSTELKLLEKVFKNNREKRIAVITSELAGDLMRSAVHKISQDIYWVKEKVDVVIIENEFFGGSIMSAGLITIEDIVNKFKKKENFYDIMLVPRIIFDIFGNDLTGKNYKLLEEECCVDIKLI